MAEPYSVSTARVRIIFLLYFTYLCYYLARKADAITKSSLQSDKGFTLDDLAFADTCYLGTYTLALFGSGMVGARVPSNVMLFIGLIGVAACSFLKSQASSPMAFAVLQVLHAIFQSTGWPTCIKVLATWVNKNRGFIMGLWTTCQSLGGVAGTIGGTWFLTRYGWTTSYTYHVPILFVMAVIDLFFIMDEPPFEWKDYFIPEDIAPKSTDSKESGSGTENKPNEDEGKASTSTGNGTISLSQVIALPGVLAVGTSYFFLKFMRYALLFWLPFYYEKELKYSRGLAGYISTSFELGGTIGTPLIGYISDKYMKGKRDLTSGLFMSGAAITLTLCILLSQWGPLVNAFCMALTGILVIGPDSVLSGTIAQDIGQSSGLGKAAVGSVAGLLNSMGSAGSIFQSGATAYISRAYGWNALFLVFVACASLSAGILFHIASKSLPPGVTLIMRISSLLFGPGRLTNSLSLEE